MLKNKWKNAKYVRMSAKNVKRLRVNNYVLFYSGYSDHKIIGKIIEKGNLFQIKTKNDNWLVHAGNIIKKLNERTNPELFL